MLRYGVLSAQTRAKPDPYQQCQESPRKFSAANAVWGSGTQDVVFDS